MKILIFSGETYSVLDVINMAIKISNKNIVYNIVERGVGNPDIVIAGSEKAKKLINWSPKYSDLSTIIDSTWKI
ncbi:MAG: hypothetical protein CMG41_04830 [Candidatus Marinimicrobia bacterium]|nr:hypothetical protein [Candidatus Neomarinimicrobiota bacterium]